MRNKKIVILSLLIFVSIACTVTRITPTATTSLVSTSTPLPLVPTITPMPTQDNGGVGADSTILAAIIQAVTAIVVAIIGGTATITAALMSKKYVDNQISHSKPSDEIKPSTRLIIRFLDLFRVTGASVFVVKNNKTYIDAETGISIAIHSYYSVLEVVDITYHLPGQTKHQIVKMARLGWRVLVNHQNDLYTLTLVSMSGDAYSFEARFDFRKVNHVIAEVQND